MGYLQNSNRELEDRLRKAIERKQDAHHEAYVATRERNDILTDLEYTEDVADKLNREKEVALDIADKEVTDAQHEVYRSHTELRKSEFEKSNVQIEKEKLNRMMEKA